MGLAALKIIPKVSDTTVQLEILRELGAKVKLIDDTTVEVDCRTLVNQRAPYALTQKVRASYYYLGALLGRYHQAEVAMPGGCNFGSVRPIDQHVKGFEALGAQIDVRNGIIYAKAAKGLSGAGVYLDVVSVGATINIMMAATLAPGLTVIENAAKEPHIVDVANFFKLHGGRHYGSWYRCHQGTGRGTHAWRHLFHHPPIR